MGFKVTARQTLYNQTLNTSYTPDTENKRIDTVIWFIKLWGNYTGEGTMKRLQTLISKVTKVAIAPLLCTSVILFAHKELEHITSLWYITVFWGQSSRQFHSIQNYSNTNCGRQCDIINRAVDLIVFLFRKFSIFVFWIALTISCVCVCVCVCCVVCVLTIECVHV